MTEPATMLPRRFGRYVLFDQIGEGGMARIFLGRDQTALGGERLVVVKQILPLLSSSDEFSKLLIDEAKLAARLSHGNVVQVYDLGREDETLYITMEYVEGFDLRELLKNCSKHRVPLPVEFSLLVVMETLRGLDYAHRKRDDDGQPLGIVHRDVSPSNVLVSFDGQIKLCDFGIARAIGTGGELPVEAIQGKASYMSPEAARGDALDARADVFAVGIILWELLSGRRLYSKSQGSSLEQARQAQIPPLVERGYPEEAVLHAIVQKSLAKDRDERYGSARELLKALSAYVQKAGLVASPLRFGAWITEHFGAEMLAQRKSREQASRQPSVPVAQPARVEPVPSRAEPAPPSVAAVVHSVREPSQREPAMEAASRSLFVWLAIALAALALVIAAIWARN